jgi:hypothetical protein
MEYWQDTKVVLGVIGGNGKLTRVDANWGLETVFAEGCRPLKGLGNNFWGRFYAKIGFGLQNISAFGDRVHNFYQCDIFYRELSSIDPTLLP